MARHPLDLASQALLECIDKEDTRPQGTTGSHLIGGIAVLGANLDAFLRALLVEVAQAAGRDPAAILPQVGKGTVSLRKATAGQLLRAGRDAAEGLSLTPVVRACIEDARRDGSVLRAVIDLRNLAVHRTVLLKDAGATLKRLGALLEKYRREAGWGR